MKKLITTLLTGCILASSAVSLATPTVEEVKADIETFQGYFKKRFPDVAMEDYKDGVNSIPQYAHRRANWELQMEFPPYEEYVEMGQAEWDEPLKDGSSLDACFEGKPGGNEYPYIDDEGKIHTIEGDINACIVAAGGEKIKYAGQKMARLTIIYRMRANGEPLNVDYSSDEMRDWYAKGREFYWTKRGQLNMACADCHVHNAGNSVRGDVLSPGLGHNTGFPVYRTKWGRNAGKKPLGTIQRRYKGCNNNIRASSFKPGGPEYTALEVYETILSSGVPLSVPSQRQ